jgi:class 3 adenylate cyclase
VVDTSSNGTRVSGIRIERAVGVPLQGGDRIQIGPHVLEFRRAGSARGADREQPRATVSVDTPIDLVIVVGDLINFSTVSEHADQTVLARDVDRLYRQLRESLFEHRGTLVDYVGDAFFASWEPDADPAAVDHALGFVVAANQMVSELTAGPELRYGDGSPLRMGWGVTMGSVVMRLMPGSVIMASRCLGQPGLSHLSAGGTGQPPDHHRH